jgi:hypothetical protein
MESPLRNSPAFPSSYTVLIDSEETITEQCKQLADFLRNSSQLKSLTIQVMNLNRHYCEMIFNCLYNNKLKLLALESFSIDLPGNLVGLQHLKILIKLLDSMKNLKTLKIISPYKSKNSLSNLDYWRANRKPADELRRLGLQGEFSELWDTIADLQKLESLTLKLDRYFPMIQSPKIQISFRHLHKLKNLTKLKLDLPLTDYSAKDIQDLGKFLEVLTKLQNLHLIVKGISSCNQDFMILVDSLLNLHDLRSVHLNFKCCHINQYGLAHIENFLSSRRFLSEVYLNLEMNAFNGNDLTKLWQMKDEYITYELCVDEDFMPTKSQKQLEECLSPTRTVSKKKQSNPLTTVMLATTSFVSLLAAYFTLFAN